MIRITCLAPFAGLLLMYALTSAAQSPAPQLPQLSGGLNGYISMHVPKPPDAYRYGVGFYVPVWSLLERPLASFQIGLPSTWIIPENSDFKGPLCPAGTYARDHWPERGPTYASVFQTIEGGLGFWGSTRFGSATPKYRMNGTPNGYTYEISSPGWGFGNTTALHDGQMGIAQLSNRLLVPPDGFTFKAGMNGEVLGNAWMALPLMESAADQVGKPDEPHVATGDQSWTLFFNAANFKGPVAFWIPQTWSKLSQGYPAIAGRGLDARPAEMSGGAMEFNTVPYFESKDAAGITYTRLPKLLFPTDDRGRTFLMQDIAMYGKAALYDALRASGARRSLPSGRFDARAAWNPVCTSQPIRFRQGPENVSLAGIEAFVSTTMVSDSGRSAFGMLWKGEKGRGVFPEYFKQSGATRVAITVDQVPEETHLKTQQFAPSPAPLAYTSPASANDESWANPGPVRGPFHVRLTDGSTVTYAWYRFVDQPALQQLHLSAEQKEALQSLVERMHARWTLKGEYMPAPSRGTPATLDKALLVAPPHGLEVGYVPIVTRQDLQ